MCVCVCVDVCMYLRDFVLENFLVLVDTVMLEMLLDNGMVFHRDLCRLIRSRHNIHDSTEGQFKCSNTTYTYTTYNNMGKYIICIKNSPSFIWSIEWFIERNCLFREFISSYYAARHYIHTYIHTYLNDNIKQNFKICTINENESHLLTLLTYKTSK